MYESSRMESFARDTSNDNDANDKNRYRRKEISTVNSQTGAESIAELNNQSPGQRAVVIEGETVED